ncbi:MAG TPA: YdeI/OmpD-associated family protein [Chitinophagales bacterium]|nr:YdeI/OmpD-associated family protein [Chitinophagales bacterium]
MAKPIQVKFTTVIQKDAKMDVTFINIDFDVEKTFGKKRLKVKAWYDNVLYRGLLTKYSGAYHMIINKEIRAQLGKKAGDTIKVKIEEDLDERSIEMPKVMIDFFKNEKALKPVFDKMSHTHHREYVSWISSAKKEETIQNRLLKFRELLQAKADTIR